MHQLFGGFGEQFVNSFDVNPLNNYQINELIGGGKGPSSLGSYEYQTVTTLNHINMSSHIIEGRIRRRNLLSRHEQSGGAEIEED